MGEVSWSRLYRCRKEVDARFGSVFRLPVVRRAVRLVRPHVRAGSRILEIGPGENRRGARLAAEVPGVTCISVDPDPESENDYRDITEAGDGFDVAMALEVIEHLSLPDALDLLRAVRVRLRSGGTLVLSTPNIYCPGAFLRDATHLTPFAFDELGGALLYTGYEVVGLYRVVQGNALRRARKALLAPLGRALGMDHAVSIAAVARASSVEAGK
jgi:SAM-dependent methyltransferase